MAILRDLPRTTLAALIIGGLLLAFLIGFVPQWNRARTFDGELRRAQIELRMLELGGRVGAALAEAQRGNYERGRQLMAGFFSTLETRVNHLENPRQREAATWIMAQRDEIITLLSRAEPEAVSRLNMIYSRYFDAFHPLGGETPTAETS